MKTIEGNKLLAPLVGLVPAKDGYCRDRKGHSYRIEQLAFDSDWNKLHQVIDAIENKGFCVDITTTHTEIWHLDPLNEKTPIKRACRVMYKPGQEKISSVWTACVKFVKWREKTLTKMCKN